MKRIALLLILAIFLLAGCSSEMASQRVGVAELNEDRFAGMEGDITIVTDKETGCKYIREMLAEGTTLQTIGLTVLLKSDGTPDCSGKTFN